MCTHNLCFEQKLEKYQRFSTDLFQFLQLKKSLYIAWACFHNVLWPIIEPSLSLSCMKPRKKFVLTQVAHFVHGEHFRGTHVPVGEDQIHHLELTRDLAQAFNRNFGATFPKPDWIFGMYSFNTSTTYGQSHHYYCGESNFS